MLSVVLSTSAALAGQQKPTHTRVVSCSEWGIYCFHFTVTNRQCWIL